MTTELDTEIATLRARRRSPGMKAWLRTLPPFDRRSIREPSERDAYWANVQARLAVSDAASLHATRASERPNPTTEPLIRAGDRLIA
jgi:hypothetical protein